MEEPTVTKGMKKIPILKIWVTKTQAYFLIDFCLPFRQYLFSDFYCNFI